MGVGPAFAIPTAVRAAGLHMSDIDVFEINEVTHMEVVRIAQAVSRLTSLIE